MSMKINSTVSHTTNGIEDLKGGQFFIFFGKSQHSAAVNEFEYQFSSGRFK